jgi:hypothetical protein
MKSFRLSLFALMLSAALPAYFSAPAYAQVAIDASVEIAPPPLPYYEQPIIPAEGYIWAPGYWGWAPTEGDYYWVPGTWVEPPQRELLWTPAYWGWEGGRYLFHSGYWGREVGFYGGIDYGFGYNGEGYFGGRWDHGVFFYNRTVNNITNVRITNVYNQTVVVNNTVNRVSFNGGNGGTIMRPTAQQEAYAHERHIEATPVQLQHAEAASKDRALFSKQNHGEPAVAATQRAGVMQGEGVTRASRTPLTPAALPAGRPEELPRPGQQPPRANEIDKEPPRPEEKAEPRPAEPMREPPKVEARPEPRSEPKVEERRPEERLTVPPKAEERRPPPPAQAERAPAVPPRVAQPPRPPAQRAPKREEEKR